MEKTVYTGKGVGVAVLDTGIFLHTDFGERVWAFSDFLSGKTRPYDDNGHGTHVAGILAGDGTASGGAYTGMAPGCGLVALKVLDRFGNGSKENVLRAFSWLLQNFGRYNIRVVNISVGTTYRTKGEHDALITGVEALWDKGLVVVAAAGNQGPRPGSVTAPGSSRKVITVGSSDMMHGRLGVSGRGPTVQCVCKPDLVAPGSQVVSCVPDGPYAYGTKSGTSMSTPLVSGAIACMLEKDPYLTNLEIKMMLKESAEDMGLPHNQQGWGRFHPARFLSM